MRMVRSFVWRNSRCAKKACLIAPNGRHSALAESRENQHGRALEEMPIRREDRLTEQEETP